MRQANPVECESDIGEEPAWANLGDDELLRLRLCDLGLGIEGSPLRQRVARLHSELEAAGVPLRPRIWLSSDWFSPDGLPGFAIPFFLAHPRLVALERSQCGAVEGETEEECMRLLRHETGHALTNAFRLHRRRAWRTRFGLYSTPYEWAYQPDPTSRAHVRNLDGWYAQSHPAEDFCETFGVWLRPRSDWLRRYSGWDALGKLAFVDDEVRRVRSLEPEDDPGEETEPLEELTLSLATYYRRRRKRYAAREAAVEDEGLRSVFGEPAEGAPTAPWFLRRHRSSLLRSAARRGTLDLYGLDQLLGRLANRSFALGLTAHGPEHELLPLSANLLTHEADELIGGRTLELQR